MTIKNLADYESFCLGEAARLAAGYDIGELAAQEDDLNAYPGLENLNEPREIIYLEDRLNPALIARAEKAILDGRIFWEHTAAGEATRLKMGFKFLISPHTHLSLSNVAKRQTEETGQTVSTDGALKWLGFDPAALWPLNLGWRHLGQKFFEIAKLAEKHKLDPAEVLGRQKMLIILSEDLFEVAAAELKRFNNLPVRSEHLFMMVQRSFHGLNRGPDGQWFFDRSSPKRLHNHGQMAMQKVMDSQVFHFGSQGRPVYLASSEFLELLDQADNAVSYNIEDLGYLTAALDFETIGLALALGDDGYGMTMEIVPNNPANPIKGGLCAHDPALGRDVVIESFRLKGLKPADIKYLNKNFNHFPKPSQAMRRLQAEALPMPISVKDGRLYFQPVQGDLNSLVKTAFVGRHQPAPINGWKTWADTPGAAAAMARQDAQPGFIAFIKKSFSLIN